MAKSIITITIILALSTSAALPAHRTHHRHVTNAYAGVPASPVAPMGGMSSGDQTQYMKNLHDSGYNKKNDYDKNGILITQ